MKQIVTSELLSGSGKANHEHLKIVYGGRNKETPLIVGTVDRSVKAACNLVSTMAGA